MNKSGVQRKSGRVSGNTSNVYVGEMGFIDAGFYPDVSSGKEEKCVTQFCHQEENTIDHLL